MYSPQNALDVDLQHTCDWLDRACSVAVFCKFNMKGVDVGYLTQFVNGVILPGMSIL